MRYIIALILVFVLGACCTNQVDTNPCPEAGAYQVSIWGDALSLPEDCREAFAEIGAQAIDLTFEYQAGAADTGYGCVERFVYQGDGYQVQYKVDADPVTGWFEHADVTVFFPGGLHCYLKGVVHW